jgi:hypothetical protein
VIKNIGREIFFRKQLHCLTVLAGLIVMISGCSFMETSIGNYNSDRTYSDPIYSKIMQKSMGYEGVDRNPVVFIHGFLGSKLNSIKTGKNIWGYFSVYSAFTGYSDTELRELSYPMVYGKPLDEIKDDAVSVSVLGKVDIDVAGLDFKLNAYDELIDILKKCGYALTGEPLPKDKNFYSLFVFHYDWRKDLVENASILHKFLLEKRSYLQEEYEKLYGVRNYDVQFDFVAHSMGGLLSRYYLRYGDQALPKDGSMPELDWCGSKYVNKVIIIGTPNAGYLDTFYELLNGYSPAERIVDAYPPAVTGTWVTYYQMLPLLSTRSVLYEDDVDGPSVDIFDPAVWIKYKWGLANPDQAENLKIILPHIETAEERQKVAIDHLKKCLKNAKQFTDALKIHKAPPENIALYLFFGDAVETRRTATVNRKTGVVKPNSYDSGDGIVCTSSALFDERAGQKWQPKFESPITWYAITPLMAAHMGLTESRSFADDIAYCLLLAPVRK